MSDIPCAVKPVAVNIKEKEKQAAPNPLVEKEQAVLARELIEQKIMTKHSAECKDLRLALRKNGHYVPHPLEETAQVSDVDRLAREHYHQFCLPQAKDVVMLAQIQSERSSAERVRKAACELKLREYETRKQSLNSTSSDLERNAVGILQAEVSRGCR